MTDNNDDITLRDAQATVDNWITTVGGRIDLTEAFKANLRKKSERDASRHKNNSKLSN